ncbi:MAG: acyl-CoA dehydrogenase [Pseudomonadota bacterium]
MLFNPRTATFDTLDPRSREIMRKTIAFFEERGKRKLKEDDHARTFYSEFIAFQGREGIFADLLTPGAQGDGGTRWDTSRNVVFNEILAFYGLAYWYTWQVSILGLGPLWMTENEVMKRHTAQALREGGVFGFGLSEREHGADIYSTGTRLLPQEDGSFLAQGSKYYIGNANEAAWVSTFGKLGEGRDDYAFFAVSPRRRRYECVQNVCNSQSYVGEFCLDDYPVAADEVLATGRAAWDMALNTVNVGKFNLGWASIGICTHSFYEAIHHAHHRHLFGSAVTEFPHIQRLFVDAWARLVAMRLFSLRAADYMRAASEEDRRYLLYNPMVKMKVTTQGEQVMDLLWDVIAARGFEKDGYFEMAVRDIRALPKLEGTVHVNMALVIKFMANYFFKPGDFPEIPRMLAPTDDDFLWRQGPTRGLGQIRFHDYRPVYAASDLPNVRIFRRQARVLKAMLVAARPGEEQAKDFDFLLTLGELFTLVVYGQLILENARLMRVADEVVDQIFDTMVRDFSGFALQLALKSQATVAQRAFARRMARRPVADRARFDKVFRERVLALDGAYVMNP